MKSLILIGILLSVVSCKQDAVKSETNNLGESKMTNNLIEEKSITTEDDMRFTIKSLHCQTTKEQDVINIVLYPEASKDSVIVVSEKPARILDKTEYSEFGIPAHADFAMREDDTKNNYYGIALDSELYFFKGKASDNSNNLDPYTPFKKIVMSDNGITSRDFEMQPEAIKEKS